MQTLLLNITLGEEGGLHVLPALLENGGGLTVLPPGQRRVPKEAITQLAQSLHARLQEAAAVIAEGGEALAQGVVRSQLHPLGCQLTEMLFDDWLIELMLEPRRIAHLVFWIDPLLNGVPFECAFLRDDFLGFRFGISREVLTTERRLPRAAGGAGSGAYAGLVVINPTGDLSPGLLNEYSQFHKQWVADTREERLIHFTKPSTLSKANVLNRMAQHQFVNLVGHHEYEPASPSQSGYPLPGGDVLTAEDVVAKFRRGAAQPPLIVFSMGCESGLTHAWANWQHDDRVHGLVDAALRVRIPHYIGTLTKFPARPSGQFFAPFYGALAEGDTVGQAVRRVRLSFRQTEAGRGWEAGGTALGLALVLYGDPASSYFTASGRRCDCLPTMLCEEVVGTERCGRAATADERGFAQRRCVWHTKGWQCSAGHPVEHPNDLKKCRKCANTLCPQCAGHSQSLCWEHCCFEGHEIIGTTKKICPDRWHPGEKRSVCPLDPGWLRDGLCRDCLSH